MKRIKRISFGWDKKALALFISLFFSLISIYSPSRTSAEVYNQSLQLTSSGTTKAAQAASSFGMKFIAGKLMLNEPITSGMTVNRRAKLTHFRP